MARCGQVEHPLCKLGVAQWVFSVVVGSKGSKFNDWEGKNPPGDPEIPQQSLEGDP
jgi:hypothetical protein